LLTRAALIKRYHYLTSCNRIVTDASATPGVSRLALPRERSRREFSLDDVRENRPEATYNH